MLSDAERARYLRHILLKEVGAQGQRKLLDASVLVVGAGGLGAPIVQYLAAAGVGRLGVVDDDRVDVSNLQRQVIYRDADVGRPKAATAAAAAKAIAPDLQVDAIDARFDAANADLAAAYDVVVEGVDAFAARYDINRACLAARTPLVSAALGRFDGQVATFKPYAGDLPCYRCFAPAPPPADAVLACGDGGVLGPVAGVVGSIAALEVLKELLGLGDSLAGRLWLFDGLSGAARVVDLPRDPACADCGAVRRPA